ncbi:MAG: hypothetical protein JWO13_1397 [Acidobacteriales bacterium]|nr:hypothetical protein [Terriglobales bacterium]
MRITSRNIVATVAFVTALVLNSFAAGPSVDALKQALTARLLQLKPTGMSERQILFQEVRAGSSGNFRVTALVRDYGAGYPKNRYYGETCVGRFDNQDFTMAPDGFGGWQVQGAMTPSMDESQCKKNPAAGVSSIPLASLAGAAAPTGGVTTATTKPAAGGGGGKVALGKYECWAYGQSRMGLNFTIKSASQYVGSDGKSGSYSLDGNTGRMTFTGGSLDGVLPKGFFELYYEPRGIPTVSFRNSGGSEVSFCEKAR